MTRGRSEGRSATTAGGEEGLGSELEPRGGIGDCGSGGGGRDIDGVVFGDGAVDVSVMLRLCERRVR